MLLLERLNHEMRKSLQREGDGHVRESNLGFKYVPFGYQYHLVNALTVCFLSV